MRIILTDDVIGVGDIGETVSVRPGFARNYLIPRGVAIESETASAREIAHKMLQIEAKKRRLKGDAERRAQQIQDIKLDFGLRVGSGGKVFGSVNARQIAEKLQEQGLELDRRRVLIAEPIRKLGERTVKIKLHADVVIEIQINVTALSASADQEQAEADEARDAIEAAADARAEGAEEGLEAPTEDDDSDEDEVQE